MTDLLAAAWAADQQYLQAPGRLLTEGPDFWSLLSAAGLLCLVIGVVLAVAWREKQALWMIGLFAFAALVPVWLGLAKAALGWLALTFALFVGGILLVIAVGLVANDAPRRLPVWLIGIFVLSLAASSGIATFIANVAV